MHLAKTKHSEINIIQQLLSTFCLDSLGSRGSSHAFFHFLFELVLDPEPSVLPGLGGIPSPLMHRPRCDLRPGLVFEILLGHLISFEGVQALSWTIWTPSSFQSSHRPLPVNELLFALYVLNILPIVLNLSFGSAEDLF